MGGEVTPWKTATQSASSGDDGRGGDAEEGCDAVCCCEDVADTDCRTQLTRSAAASATSARTRLGVTCSGAGSRALPLVQRRARAAVAAPSLLFPQQSRTAASKHACACNGAALLPPRPPPSLTGGGEVAPATALRRQPLPHNRPTGSRAGQGRAGAPASGGGRAGAPGSCCFC